LPGWCGPILTVASRFSGHDKRLTRAKPQIHHKSVGLKGGRSILFMIIVSRKQTETFGELAGVE
jgi:hypothetical protein